MNEDIKLSKDIKLNSKALLKNLELAEAKLKGGAKLGDALTQLDLAWYQFTDHERSMVRDKLSPRPTREYTRKLNKLIEKYGPIQDDDYQGWRDTN